MDEAPLMMGVVGGAARGQDPVAVERVATVSPPKSHDAGPATSFAFSGPGSGVRNVER
jgi:hypothetical protein